MDTDGKVLGGGFLYRNNKHDRGSYEKSVVGFCSWGSSSTFGGFVEIGYDLDVTDYFKFYSILALAMGVSLIEDYSKELIRMIERELIKLFSKLRFWCNLFNS